VRATQSNCCGALDLLSPEPCLPTAPSWAHWLQDSGSHTAAWVWVVSQKDWRNQGATGWILAMHWYSIWVKNAIFVFPVLPVSAEAQVIWGGTVKRLLIAYFIGNISSKNIKMRSRMSKVGRFLRHFRACDGRHHWRTHRPRFKQKCRNLIGDNGLWVGWQHRNINHRLY